MTEIVLLSVIAGLITLIAYKEKVAKEEREKFINAILSKNATELRDLDVASKLKVEVKPQPKPDLIPTEDLNDEEWEKQVVTQY